MPALPAAPQTLSLRFHLGIGEDLVAVCREFWRYTGGPPSSADLVTLAGTIRSNWGTNMAGLFTSDRSLKATEITDLTSPTSAFGEDTTAVSGTRSGEGLPGSICVVQSKEVFRRYRGGHPRTYWPAGANEDKLDAQQWSSSFVTAFHTAYANFVNDWTTDLPSSLATVTEVNVSYYFGSTVHTGTTGRARNVPTPRAAPVIDLITSNVTRAGIGAQRRRLLRLA